MMNTETSSSQNGLTEDKILQESTKESTDPVGENDLPEGAKNVQHAIQLAREREKAAREEAESIRAKLREIEAREKQAKMADMSETERYKTLAQEESQKRGKLELKLTVQEAIAGKSLPKGVEDILIRSPWAIPAVQDELGDEFTWDDAIASVKRHLPEYVESLVVGPVKPLEDIEPSSKRVDSERSIDSGVVRKHIYTREEVARLGKDPVEWAKHEAAVLKQMAENGGNLPQ